MEEAESYLDDSSQKPWEEEEELMAETFTVTPAAGQPGEGGAARLDDVTGDSELALQSFEDRFGLTDEEWEVYRGSCQYKKEAMQSSRLDQGTAELNQNWPKMEKSWVTRKSKTMAVDETDGSKSRVLVCEIQASGLETKVDEVHGAELKVDGVHLEVREEGKVTLKVLPENGKVVKNVEVENCEVKVDGLEGDIKFDVEVDEIEVEFIEVTTHKGPVEFIEIEINKG